jgi:hypothetical protein
MEKYAKHKYKFPAPQNMGNGSSLITILGNSLKIKLEFVD